MQNLKDTFLKIFDAHITLRYVTRAISRTRNIARLAISDVTTLIDINRNIEPSLQN